MAKETKTNIEIEGEEEESTQTEDAAQENEPWDAASDEGADEEKQPESEEELQNGEDSQEQEDSPKEASEEKGKKKFGKKKDKKDEQIAELSDRVKRQLAEFENFRTRSEKEKSQMYDMGAKNIVEKILPVVDSFERGLADAKDGDPFVDGMKMIYKQLMTSLEQAGVTPIEALGQEFNPDFHNAVMQVESKEYETGVIAQELQKGYMYRDTVVRHSMVAVVQ